MNDDALAVSEAKPRRLTPRYGWRRGLLTLATGLTCWGLLTNPREAGVGHAVRFVHRSAYEILGLALLAALLLAPVAIGGWLLRRAHRRRGCRPTGYFH